ncbi:MAG TPA: RNA-binding S4 domain-containing protein [Candidatus Cybelea sp.]|nr:RNA-binding S4 domain-containing protein [Candidatus Cybelea sp.]
MNDGALRIDRWLWFARLCKSRSLAARLCEDGYVRLNRIAVAKPAATVKPGDVLTLPQGTRIRVVRIVALGNRRGPPAEARALYEDLVASGDA